MTERPADDATARGAVIRGEALQRWIDGRTPPVPAGFASRMAPTGTGDAASGDVVTALADEAEHALRLALSPEGRDRGGAFDLLAADGFLTWAAEAALETEDPDAALADLIARFAR